MTPQAAVLDRVLVVDDDESGREMLRRRLERAGFTVEAVESGGDALARLEQADFDLLLLDRSMPVMCGMEVLRRIRLQRDQRQLPVIMVTAEAHGEAVSEALEAGANDYITKPVDFRVALARIRTHLDRRRAELTLQQSEERYALAVEGSNDVVVDWDLTSGSLYLSSRWNQLLGLSSAQATGSAGDWFNRVHPLDLANLHEAIAAHTSGQLPSLEVEHRLRHADGTYRWIRSRCKAVQDAEGKPVRISGALTDVTSARIADPLTGLPNRTYLLERLTAAIERSSADGTPLAVLFFDLDGFKYVNDSLGHTAGDILLMQVAQRLLAALDCRQDDRLMMARLGGDEFALLASGLGSGQEQGRRILESLSEAFPVDSHQVYVTASIGIAVHNPNYSAAHEMLRDADTAMYRAKALGKSQLAVFSDEMRAEVTGRHRLGNRIREAVSHREFALAFQPIVSLDSGSVTGLEALLRWPGGLNEGQPMEEVIRVAEETGVMMELGDWILDQACRSMVRLRDVARARLRLLVHVNVSAVQFASAGLHERVLDTVRRTGIPPECLVVEITESAVLKDSDAVLDSLRKLKAGGVRLSIDDFGTGYSSLSYLHRFPFDTLKLDRSFIQNLDQSGSQAEVVRAVIQLAHALKMEVVAEGIETQAEASTLRQFGCELGQGYHFARPMPENEAIEFLRRSG